MRIFVSCGGTGGHAYPGIAAARELAARGNDVALIVSGRDAESSVSDSLRRVSIRSVPVSPKRPWSLVVLARGFFTALRLFKKEKPDALLAMGSYSSIAPVLAARVLWIPVILHEANVLPGVAVKRLSRFAKTVCISFPESEKRLPGARTVLTGVPMFKPFERGIGSSQARADAFTLLVMGGSQGAKAVNEAVVGALAALRSRDAALFAKLRVAHLAGPKNADEVRALYAAAGLSGDAYEIVPFEKDMPKRYAQADFCISRAGASSCFELALAGLPALFIPLPRLAHGHQVFNAESMHATGAGDTMSQDGLSPEALADYLSGVASDASRRAAMREALLARALPDAASRVADAVLAAANGVNVQ